jgi:hypothetical protein
MDKHLSLMDKTTIELKKGISFGAQSGSIIEITKAAIEPDAIPGARTSKKYALWGSDNNRPQSIIDENMSEGSSAGALRFKVWAHYGKGLQLYRRTVEKDREIIVPIDESQIPAEIEDFFFANDIENFAQGIISDFEWWSFYYAQYIPNKLRNKIVGINWKRAKDLRTGIRNPKTGAIDNYYISGQWPLAKEADIAEVPALDRANPFATANGIYRHSLVSIDKDYYPTPYWQSNLKWLAVAKKIPDWINANIENSVNIKYHIEIPEEYFISLYPADNYSSQAECLQARMAAEMQIKTDIDSMLAGAKNASKIFYTKIAVDANGSQLPGWKINELKNDVKDSAWLNAYGTAAVAICTAHGTPPSLQGLVLPTGLGTGSGSDVREQFNAYVQLHTVIPRQTTMEWFNLVKRYNGWPKDIHLGYRDIVLQSVNENKSGYAVSNENKPTTAHE